MVLLTRIQNFAVHEVCKIKVRHSDTPRGEIDEETDANIFTTVHDMGKPVYEDSKSNEYSTIILSCSFPHIVFPPHLTWIVNMWNIRCIDAKSL